MSGCEKGYYGPSETDLGCGAIALVAFVALGTVMVAVLCFMSLHSEDTASPSADTGGFAVDVTDEWAMHRAGLPTKADVLAWHMYGRWAFYEAVGGEHEVHIWHDLPGGAAVWDALYGLDPDNPAFKFKDDVRGDVNEA